MDKILVIQTAFIGDAVLTLPMIQKLKELNPDNSIDVLSIPSTAEIFKSSPFVSGVIVLDKKGRHKSISSLIKFSGELKKNNYSVIYSPHRSLRSSLIVMMLNVKESYGFSNSSFKYVYRHIIKYIPAHHEVQRNLDLIGYSNNDNWKILPEISVPESSAKKVEDYLLNNNLSGNLAAIAPGSVWETKKYPEKYFKELISYFLNRKFKIVLLGSGSDKALCESLAGAFDGNVCSSAGIFSIVETISLLKKARLLISNDSAPAHFAMCANIPALTIYCSTVPGFGFYPYNEGSKYISLEGLKCKPCGIHGHKECPLKTFDCGNNLKPQSVILKIEEILNGSI